jgi:glycosyltransferase involved in cell wall biosynthesis
VKLRPPKYSILGLNLAMYTKPVGIYMPTRNRVELLKKAIASVQAQSYQNFKLVIVNDGSTDGTQAFLDSIMDLRISFIENIEPEGACASRNKAIVNLDTELITGLDDDDVFLPERLADLLSVMTKNTPSFVVAIFGITVLIKNHCLQKIGRFLYLMHLI